MAQLPSHTIAHDRRTNRSPHDESAPCRTIRPCGTRVNHHRARRNTGTGAHHHTVVSRPPYASGSGKHGRTGRLGRNAGATLAATCGEHSTAGPGTHACPEAVRLGTPAVVRLEGALHRVSSLRLGVLGRRALGTYTTGRTDLFLGTKVRNGPISGQTRAAGTSRPVTSSLEPGDRWAATGGRGSSDSEPVENSCPSPRNGHRFAHCCESATSWTTHSAEDTAQEEVSARG